MRRKVVLARNEYADFVNAQNNRTNVYTTVYDFEHFSERAKVESSVIIDRVFLDFDAHTDNLDMAWRDVKQVMELVINRNYSHTFFFSGRGFHMFLFGERAKDMRSVQTFFREIKQYLISKVGSNITLDDRVGQTTRLRRVPNTVNMSSSDFALNIAASDSILRFVVSLEGFDSIEAYKSSRSSAIPSR